MIIEVDGCACCAMPCVGGHCRYAEQSKVVCDCCEFSTDVFYISEDEVLCRECFIRSSPNGEDEIENAQTITAEELLKAVY